MLKDDEIRLYAHLRAMRPKAYDCGHALAHECFAHVGIPDKRGYYLLGKWTKKGWWDYGVSLRGGWFTPEAPASLQ